MDPHSLEIERDGKHVGYIQWHSGCSPRVVLSGAFAYLSLSELEDVLAAYKEHRARLG